MTFNESTFTFTGDPNNRMLGFIHRPENFATNVGLLIIVGGPQYHIGAHRQYVHMARHCATQGIAVMRFDYQGVGDSEGLYPGFEYITPDIHCAVYEFLKRTPEIQSVAIWGLCEGASAILLGGAEHKDLRCPQRPVNHCRRTTISYWGPPPICPYGAPLCDTGHRRDAVRLSGRWGQRRSLSRL